MASQTAEIDPQRLAALQAKFQQYNFLQEREFYEGSLTEFVKGAWSSIDSSEYQPSWAGDAICDHLEAVTLGHIPRLLINVPPRCSKTTIASICWPAWTWAQPEAMHSFWAGPHVKFLCGSYGNSLALLSSNTMRRLIVSPWYQRYWANRYGLTEDQNTKNRYDTTEGGSRQATSVGSSLLGLGGDCIIVDDPHNTETEKVVETDADRVKVASWWRELSSTRLNNPKLSAIVVVMQRLHEGDLSGIILDSTDEDWVHLMIPMRHDPQRHCVTVKLPQYDVEESWEDPRVEEDELMWPERFGEAEVRRLESRLGPYMASGRLQQSPSPKGGGIIKREWWQPWDAEEAQRYGLSWGAELKEFPHFELVVGSLDTSYGEKQENDFNALTIWGIWIDKNKNRRAMLMFGWAKRLPLHGTTPPLLLQFPGEATVNYEHRLRKNNESHWGLIEWIADTCKRYKVRRLLIENKTRGRDVANEIKRLYEREPWAPQLLDPVGDKVSRTHSVVSIFTDNAVWAPDTRWAEQIIDQCQKFPKTDHDDLHDTVTQVLHWFRENGILIRADEASAALEDESAYRQPVRSIASHYGI